MCRHYVGKLAERNGEMSYSHSVRFKTDGNPDLVLQNYAKSFYDEEGEQDGDGFYHNNGKQYVEAVRITEVSAAIYDALNGFVTEVTLPQKGDKVAVKFYDHYSDPKLALTHSIELDDQRASHGQLHVEIAGLGAECGAVDLSVSTEINVNPLNGTDHLPCVHVHLNENELAFSVFKVGDKLLLRPEANMSFQSFRSGDYITPSQPQTFFWVAGEGDAQ